jgi:thymidylate synthase ThyX
MGKRHITVLRFIDISIMTEGLHRAGQDDVDAHARRFDNRIIRNSTRLATFSDGEVSDFYKDKIIPTNQALNILGISVPEKIEYNGEQYVKSANGYIKAEYKDDKDVKRGLYMLSIPSNFISKINLCEWAHVFKERNKDGGANPEVKEWAENVMNAISSKQEQITRGYVLSVEN